MSCSGLPRTLVQVLADALYRDESGNVFLNTSVLRVDCNNIEPAASCNIAISDSYVGESISSTDDCGNNALLVGLPELEPSSGPIILEESVWDDLRAPASGINPQGAPSPATANTADGSLTFSKGNVATAWFQLPHGWKEGTDLHVHIHWSKATSAAGTVHWQMKYKWANIGDVMPAFSALSDGAEVIANANTANLHALLEWEELDGTGKKVSSMLGVFIQRTNDGGDTYAGNANLYEIDVHYEVDTLGSATEYNK